LYYGKERLHRYSKKNEIADNISANPIKFAYRYTDKKDIEVSGLIALWMSYGNREEYEKNVERLLEIVMDNSPYNFIMLREYENVRITILVYTV